MWSNEWLQSVSEVNSIYIGVRTNACLHSYSLKVTRDNTIYCACCKLDTCSNFVVRLGSASVLRCKMYMHFVRRNEWLQGASVTNFDERCEGQHLCCAGCKQETCRKGNCFEVVWQCRDLRMQSLQPWGIQLLTASINHFSPTDVEGYIHTWRWMRLHMPRMLCKWVKASNGASL